MSSLLDEAQADFQAVRYKDAAEKYRKLIEADPDDALAYQELARCLARLRQYDEAISAAQRALELNPQMALPHGLLGFIHLSRKQYDAAESELRKAIELDPASTNAYINLAYLLLHRKQLDEAEWNLLKVTQIDPNNSLAYQHLCWIYSKQKRHSEASIFAYRAFKLAPSLETASRLYSSYSARHSILFLLLTLALILGSISVRSPLTLLLIALPIADLLFLAVQAFRSSEFLRALVAALSLAGVIALYWNAQVGGNTLEWDAYWPVKPTDALRESDVNIQVNSHYWAPVESVWMISSERGSQVFHPIMLTLELIVTNKLEFNRLELSCAVRDSLGRVVPNWSTPGAAVKPNSTWTGKMYFDFPETTRTLWLDCAPSLPQIRIQ